MQYKLVAIDCDGTLVDNNLCIPQENIEIIRLLTEKDVQFIIATGRNDVLVKDYIEILKINSPIIGCNGATTRNIKTKKLYSMHPIENSSVLQVWNYFRSKNLHHRVFTLETFYTPDKDEASNKDKNFFTELILDCMDIKYFDDISKILENKEEILKIVFSSDDFDQISKIQKDLKVIKNIEIFRSSPYCIDIMAKNVSKGNALSEYIKTININPDEVVAIGDSENDYSMLKNSGFAVAMGNAENSIKEIADFVTDKNYNAGVAKALKKIFEL